MTQQKHEVGRFIEALARSFSEVLNQCSGMDWKASNADEQPIGEPSWVLVKVSGGLQGDFAFGLQADTGPALAQALLMAPEIASTFGPDEQEACVELLRQICGRAATTLREVAGEVTLVVGEIEPPKWTVGDTTTILLERGGWKGNLILTISDQLLASLDGHEDGTDKPALEAAMNANNLDLLLDVRLGARLRFGARRMRLREILELQAGAVIELNRQAQEPVDLLVDQKLIARGEVVVVDGKYGLRVGEIMNPEQLVQSLY